MLPVLRPYQSDVITAVMDSVTRQRGLTFSIEIARQGGKNELSARLEIMLLYVRSHESDNLVKCSPTFMPQAVISMTRLKDRLDNAGFTGVWVTEHDYIIRFGNARAIFLSADESSRVVGHTAHLLLEIDEAQDVGKEKYSKEFRPMGSTTNVTTVLYGTAWDDSTLLEETKQLNLELEHKDGIRRHFRYDWHEVAKYNPGYQSYVENERRRLGENHPLFLTQYCLQPICGGGGFLSAAQRAQLQGCHPRRRYPDRSSPVDPASKGGKTYIAAVDLAGEAKELEGEYLTALNPPQDSTVVTIGELDLSQVEPGAFSLSLEGRGIELAPYLIRGEGVHRSSLISDIESSPNNSLLSPSWERARLEKNLSHYPNLSLDSSPLSPLRERARVRGNGPIRIVEHYQWTGRRHTELYPQLVDLLKNVWRCRRVVVDATGIGQPVASFLREALGKHVVTPFTFTVPAKSQLGFNLLAAVNSGRLKMYASDSSPEYREFWHQLEQAKSYYRPSRTMNFFVDPARGHDDFLISLALLVEAANHSEPRIARGR